MEICKTSSWSKTVDVHVPRPVVDSICNFFVASRYADQIVAKVHESLNCRARQNPSHLFIVQDPNFNFALLEKNLFK